MVTAAAERIGFLVLDCAFALFMVGVCLCYNPKPPENTDRRAVQTALPAPPRMTAAAAVVKLRYFRYSTVGRRASEKLVCAICLDVFQHGESCGEVPACRHFFHAACIDVWKKSSVTCPLCSCHMTTASSGRISAADDMV